MGDTVKTNEENEVTTLDSVNAALGMGGDDESLSDNEATNQPTDTTDGVDPSTEIITSEGNGDAEVNHFVSDESNQTGDQSSGTDETNSKTGDENTPQISSEEQDALDEKNWSERTHKRFKSLTQQNAELTEVQKNHESLRTLINDSVADPNELVQVLDFTKALKTGNYQGALTMIDKMRNDIILRSGINPDTPDPLAAYPDLRQSVDQMQMAEEHALEVAKARYIQEQHQQQNQQLQTNQQQEQQYQQQVQQAVGQLNELEQQWLATDPMAEQKLKQLQTQVEQVSKTYPPHLWANSVQMLYNNIQLAPVQKPQPLRSNNATPPKTEPKDTLGTINKVLGF